MVTALAHAAQWLGVVRKAKGRWFDSSQGMCLGRRFGPQSGRMWEATGQCFFCTLMFLCPSFSLPSPLSKKMNK